MAAKDRVEVEILAQTKKAIGDVAKFAAGITAAVFAVKKIMAVMSDMQDAWYIQEQAETKLAAALKATGNQVGYTQDQLQRYAKELAAMTTLSDEAIIGAQGLMTTFTQVGRDVFPQAIEAAADMSAMFGQDLQQSVIQLGTALNDPIAGVGRLKRIGISFTQDQKDMIAGFMDQNDIMSAQRVILDELSVEFGGVAKAMSDTTYGAAKKLENAFVDLKEVVGKWLSEAAEPMTRWLTGFINEIVAHQEELDRLTKVYETYVAMRKGDAAVEKIPLQERIAAMEETINQNEMALEGLKKINQENSESAQWIKNTLELDRADLIVLLKQAAAGREQARENKTILDLETAILDLSALRSKAQREMLSPLEKQIMDMRETERQLTEQNRMMWELNKLQNGKRAGITDEIAQHDIMLTNYRAMIAAKEEELRLWQDIKDEAAEIIPYTEPPDIMSKEFRTADIVPEPAGGGGGQGGGGPDVLEMIKERMDAVQGLQSTYDSLSISFGTLSESEREYLGRLASKLTEAKDQLAELGIVMEEPTRRIIDLTSTLTSAFESMFTSVGQGWEGMKDAAKGAVAAILKALGQQALAEALLALASPFTMGAAPGLFAASAAAFIGAGIVASLDKGGIVKEDTLAMVHKGEKIIPLDKQGGMGMTIIQNIYGSVIRERELLDKTAMHTRSKG